MSLLQSNYNLPASSFPYCFSSSINKKIYTLYLTNSVHNAATLLRAEIYSPIICGCLLLHLNSTHSVSSGNFASSRTRLLKYSTNLIAITSHTFFQSTEITHKLLSDSMR